MSLGIASVAFHRACRGDCGFTVDVHAIASHRMTVLVTRAEKCTLVFSIMKYTPYQNLMSTCHVKSDQVKSDQTKSAHVSLTQILDIIE